MFFSLLLEPICPATCKKKKKKGMKSSLISQGSDHSAQLQTLNKHLKERRMDESLRLRIQNRCEKNTGLRAQWTESRSHGRTEWTYQPVLQIISQMWWHLHDVRKKKKKFSNIPKCIFVLLAKFEYVYVYTGVDKMIR